MDIVVVLVDRSGRIQHMNLLAARRMATLSAVTIQCWRLVAADAADDSRLQNLIQRAAVKSGSSAPRRSGGAMTIRRPQTTAELHISVVPAPERMHRGIPEGCAAVFIGELRSAPRPRGEILRGLYDLTATEARLADCLLEGKELRHAAEALSITWATARFHLKRIFAKTGTFRQTELMRLMLSLPGQGSDHE
jgi:DNA-binding CsgD family transcriptional regulator